MPFEAIASSTVEGLDYNPMLREMTVTFKQKGRNPGTVYVVKDVPPSVVEEFKGAKSPGRYYRTVVRPNFAVERRTA